MSENAQVAKEEKAAKPKTEVTQVKMSDGRTVDFAGKRKMLKEVTVGADGSVEVRFDFRNGESRLVSTQGLSAEIQYQALGHGLSQKIGDETAGEADLDDMVVAVDSIIERLTKGEWNSRKAEGDSFSGASVVIKAICEATGKDVDFVKKFLQGKLDAAESAGQKLTRKALYDSFRAPGTKTAAIIERLEAEKRAKTVGAVKADDLLAELG